MAVISSPPLAAQCVRPKGRRSGRTDKYRRGKIGKYSRVDVAPFFVFFLTGIRFTLPSDNYKMLFLSFPSN